MLLKITPDLLVICEQDGEMELLIKKKFSQAFMEYGKPLRAYLVCVQYVEQPMRMGVS